MTRNTLTVLAAAAALSFAVTTPAAMADPGAANACPPYGFLDNINYAVNPSMEVLGPNGSPTTWFNGMFTPAPSAAQGWYMHSSNAGATVTSELVATNVPGPGGTKMLRFIAGGNEGGIYQRTNLPPIKLMFSAWVKVRRGHIALQAQGGNTGPVSWSTKLGEWEQLRVCTDGTVPTDLLVIYNQAPTGGEFYVDRIEVRKIP